MSEPLDSIIEAFRNRNYDVEMRHVWENFVLEPDRPSPSAIVESIADDAPKLILDDPEDSRGGRAEIGGIARNGRAIHSHVGYERNPMKIITAWHVSMAEYNGIS